jgi:hypothetical protein
LDKDQNGSSHHEVNDFSIHAFTPQFKIQNSLDHLIRPRQHVRRNRQPDLLGGL